jgi:hypothetical protein
MPLSSYSLFLIVVSYCDHSFKEQTFNCLPRPGSSTEYSDFISFYQRTFSSSTCIFSFFLFWNLYHILPAPTLLQLVFFLFFHRLKRSLKHKSQFTHIFVLRRSKEIIHLILLFCCIQSFFMTDHVIVCPS